jgi:hypothetical protein
MGGECFPSSVARHNLEFKLCTRNKVVRIPIEYRFVQEYVVAIVVRPDKPVTAHMIELQYPACGQLCPPPFRTCTCDHAITAIRCHGVQPMWYRS